MMTPMAARMLPNISSRIRYRTPAAREDATMGIAQNGQCSQTPGVSIIAAPG